MLDLCRKPLFFYEFTQIPDHPAPKARRYAPVLATYLIGDPSQEVFVSKVSKDFDVAIANQNALSKWRKDKAPKSHDIAWRYQSVTTGTLSYSIGPAELCDFDFESFYTATRGFLPQLPRFPFIARDEQTLEEFKARVLLQADFIGIILRAVDQKVLIKADEAVLRVIAKKLTASKFA